MNSLKSALEKVGLRQTKPKMKTKKEFYICQKCGMTIYPG